VAESDRELSDRVSRLEGKIDLTNAKVDSLQEATKAGFEQMNVVTIEHWKNFELQLEASRREQSQQIQFITSNLGLVRTDQQRQEQALSATDMNVAMIASDVKRLQDRQVVVVDEIKAVRDREIKAIKDNLRWTARGLAMSVLAFAVWALEQSLTK
jgi:septation ring formation regulator EzrA